MTDLDRRDACKERKDRHADSRNAYMLEARHAVLESEPGNWHIWILTHPPRRAIISWIQTVDSRSRWPLTG